MVQYLVYLRNSNSSCHCIVFDLPLVLAFLLATQACVLHMFDIPQFINYAPGTVKLSLRPTA